MRNAERLSRYAVSRILPSVTLPRGFPRLRESFSIPLLPLAPPRYPFLSLFALLSIFLSLPSSLARSHSLGLSRRIRYSRFFRGRPRDAGRPVAAFVVEFTRTTRGKSALRATKSRPTPGRSHFANRTRADGEKGYRARARAAVLVGRARRRSDRDEKALVFERRRREEAKPNRAQIARWRLRKTLEEDRPAGCACEGAAPSPSLAPRETR